MGGVHSSDAKQIFDALDRDHSGILTLEEIMTIQKIPGFEHHFTKSPLLLFKFDESQQGTLDYEEFSKLLRHLKKMADKSIKKKKKEKKKCVRTWTTVKADSNLELDRNSETPIFTSRNKHEVRVDGSWDEHGQSEGDHAHHHTEDEEDDLDAELAKEAGEWFGKLIRSSDGRKKFVTWLFRLVDFEKTECISTKELECLLKALQEDGIDTENLTYEECKDNSELTRSIMQEYDTKHLGFLTKDEFMALADLILKNYELKSSNTEEDSVGKYVLKRKLGSGSSGVVKLAINKETGDKYAVKIIPKGDVSDLSRIDVEIKAMLLLRHPTIVKLEEVLETKDHIFFVMELCGGGTVADYVTIKPFNESIARFFFCQLVEGVQYCHSRGVCHRDLKLENLLLDNSGNLKISDFGHSGIYREGWDLFATALVGSLYHVSPEQIQGKCYSGEKVDIWAMGVVLYRMLVGAPPFMSDHAVEIMDKIKKAQYSLPDQMSPDVKDLINRMLQEDPEKRPTAEQILEHPWTKGKKDLPCLVSKKVQLEDPFDHDKSSLVNTVCDAVKVLNIHIVPPDPTLPPQAQAIKCCFPAKDMKFSVQLKVRTKQEQEIPYFEFNLREGESWDFQEIVDKIKQGAENLLAAGPQHTSTANNHHQHQHHQHQHQHTESSDSDSDSPDDKLMGYVSSEDDSDPPAPPITLTSSAKKKKEKPKDRDKKSKKQAKKRETHHEIQDWKERVMEFFTDSPKKNRKSLKVSQDVSESSDTAVARERIKRKSSVTDMLHMFRHKEPSLKHSQGDLHSPKHSDSESPTKYFPPTPTPTPMSMSMGPTTSNNHGQGQGKGQGHGQGQGQGQGHGQGAKDRSSLRCTVVGLEPLFEADTPDQRPVNPLTVSMPLPNITTMSLPVTPDKNPTLDLNLNNSREWPALPLAHTLSIPNTPSPATDSSREPSPREHYSGQESSPRDKTKEKEHKHKDKHRHHKHKDKHKHKTDYHSHDSSPHGETSAYDDVRESGDASERKRKHKHRHHKHKDKHKDKLRESADFKTPPLNTAHGSVSQSVTPNLTPLATPTDTPTHSPPHSPKLATTTFNEHKPL